MHRCTRWALVALAAVGLAVGIAASPAAAAGPQIGQVGPRFDPSKLHRIVKPKGLSVKIVSKPGELGQMPKRVAKVRQFSPQPLSWTYACSQVGLYVAYVFESQRWNRPPTNQLGYANPPGAFGTASSIARAPTWWRCNLIIGADTRQGYIQVTTEEAGAGDGQAVYSLVQCERVHNGARELIYFDNISPNGCYVAWGDPTA